MEIVLNDNDDSELVAEYIFNSGDLISCLSNDDNSINQRNVSIERNSDILMILMKTDFDYSIRFKIFIDFNEIIAWLKK